MKSIFLFLFLTIATASFSQIQINKPVTTYDLGEANRMGKMIAKIDYTIKGTDTTYSLMFRNSEFSSINDYQFVTFSSEGNTLGILYDIMKSVHGPQNKDNKMEVDFRLGDTEVIVKRMNNQTLFFTGKGHFYIGSKNIDALFGK